MPTLATHLGLVMVLLSITLLVTVHHDKGSIRHLDQLAQPGGLGLWWGRVRRLSAQQDLTARTPPLLQSSEYGGVGLLLQVRVLPFPPSSVGMDVLDMIFVISSLPKNMVTLPTNQLSTVLLLVSLEVVLGKKIFVTLLALEVTRLLVYKLHVSLDVVLPGEPVPAQLAPELLHPKVGPQVRPVRLLLQLLLALGTLNKHHVSLAKELWYTEGV